MPLYEYECPKCGRFEEFVKGFSDRYRMAFCPKCDEVSEKVISLPGHRPFVSYWSEALSKDSHKPVHVASREQEAKLCKECKCARVS